jgi:hypothetical protein
MRAERPDDLDQRSSRLSDVGAGETTLGERRRIISLG